MADPKPTPMKGTVEIDETYIGGRAVRKYRKNPKPRKPKDMVLAMRERDNKNSTGRVRLFHIPNAQKETLQPILEANLDPWTDRVITDQSAVYDFSLNPLHGKNHRTVNHSKEWVVPGSKIHTNTVEAVFSLLKRGIIGSFHHISPKHLHRYLTEFEYRFNERNNSSRFGKTLQAMLTAPTMPYKELIGA
jgi:transposase-like protein